MAYRKDWVQPAQGGLGFARTMKCFGRKVNLSSADVSNINTIGLFMLPRDFVAIGLIGPAVPAFGAGLVFDLGVPGNQNVFLAASNIGAAGGVMPGIATPGAFNRTFADTEVQMTVTTKTTAAGVAGILELYIYGFIL